MNKKCCIAFFAFTLASIVAIGQIKDKKTDTSTPARRMIANKTGEKNLPRQLKEKQITNQPAVIRKDSSGIPANKVSKRKKVEGIKHKKTNK